MVQLVKQALVHRARSCIGLSTYRGSATLEDAPKVFNCFRFTQWLWSFAGVALPDQQILYPKAVPVGSSEVELADLIFIPRLNYALNQDDFGHVGIATDTQTVIHATKWKDGVIEESLATFISRGLLGIRRIPESCYCR